MTADYSLLLPQADEVTRGYWDAARRHELAAQRCNRCGAWMHPPKVPLQYGHFTDGPCLECGSEEWEWAPVSGRGTLHSYVIVSQPVLPQWREIAPYNVAIVALEEDERVQMVTNVVEIEDDALRVGMPLEVVFDDVTEEVTLPRWRPRR